MKLHYFVRTSLPSRSANSHQVMRMCNAFTSNGHELKLYCFSDKKNQDNYSAPNIRAFYNVAGKFSISKIPVLAFSRSRTMYLLSTALTLIKLIPFFKKSDADLIYGRDLLACTVAGILGKEVIFESHFPVWHSRLESFLIAILVRQKSLKTVVVITNSLKREYEQKYSQLANKLIVAPDSADEISRHGEWESKLEGSSSSLKVGYVGHLYKGKGMEIISALAKKMLDVEFHIIGGMESDVKYWKEQASTENIFFYGFICQGNLPHYFPYLDICLLPNQTRVHAYGEEHARRKQNIGDYTSPLKMFEYMAYRKPIIASDIPVLREVLTDRNALLVPPDSIGDWIKAVRLLESRDIRERLASQAYTDFTARHTWSARAAKVLSGLL